MEEILNYIQGEIERGSLYSRGCEYDDPFDFAFGSDHFLALLLRPEALRLLIKHPLTQFFRLESNHFGETHAMREMTPRRSLSPSRSSGMHVPLLIGIGSFESPFLSPLIL